jgi:hypothetical protein
MKSEIVFTAYNRPNYFEDTVKSWNNVRGFTGIPVMVHLEPSPTAETMGNIAFKLNTSVDVFLNEERQGVLTNPWNALDGAFSRGADFVILAEDDIVVSQDILEYFEWTAIEYATAYNVLAVCAFSHVGGGKPGHVVQDDHFSPLIWGTWSDRWYRYLRDTWDKDYTSGNPDGSEAGWDWNIKRIMTENNLKVIKPLHSRSDHIGEHLGTHMTPDMFSGSRGADFSPNRGRARFLEV